jgi:hypothetical protein
MWHYQVQGFIQPILFFFLCTLAGLTGFAFGTEIPHEAGWAAGLIFGGALLSFGALCLREIHDITITRRGEISFLRVVGETRVLADDILCLEGRYVADYEGQRWSLRIHYRSSGKEGKVDLPRFDDVRALAERIRVLNPSVEITGIWPRPSP